MDGVYFELADGSIYHKNQHRHDDSGIFYSDKLNMMADRAWYVEQGNWVVIKDRHDPEGIIDRPPRDTFTEMDKAQIVLSARDSTLGSDV